jgi:hypothetical protein
MSEIIEGESAPAALEFAGEAKAETIDEARLPEPVRSCDDCDPCESLQREGRLVACSVTAADPPQAGNLNSVQVQMRFLLRHHRASF